MRLMNAVERAAPNKGHLTTADVLIVEDHPGIREALGDMLREEGYEVDTARDGHEALDYLTSNPAPHLILLDLMMPGMSGWDFAALRQQNERLAHVPVVVLSGVEDIQEEAPLLQVDGFLRKPIDPNILLQVVEMYCG